MLSVFPEDTPIPVEVLLVLWMTGILQKDFTTETFGDLKGRLQFGFNRTDQVAEFDFDGTDACANVISLTTLADQYTAEASLATVDSRPWDWKVGLFFLEEDQNNDNNVDLSGPQNTAADQVRSIPVAP